MASAWSSRSQTCCAAPSTVGADSNEPSASRRAMTNRRTTDRRIDMTTHTTPTARIVVGVDGSPASIQALRWAMAQAELTSANVQAVLTWETPGQAGFDIYSAVVDWADLARRTLEIALKEAGDGAPLSIETLLLQGHPAKVLVDVSAGAQLLVVGSRGHGGFAGLMLGSVSKYVTAHASCPVLVVRDQEPASATPQPAPAP
jgi:nucleotide-binding universal stress UspA family protein